MNKMVMCWYQDAFVFLRVLCCACLRVRLCFFVCVCVCVFLWLCVCVSHLTRTGVTFEGAAH